MKQLATLAAAVLSLAASSFGQTKAVTVNPSTGALVSPSAATFKSANSIGSGSGTVTSVSVATANGVSGSVATATTTPEITIALGAIIPTSVSSGLIESSTFMRSRQFALTDTGVDHDLFLSLNENLSANRGLQFIVGDASRVLTLTGDATISGTNTGDQTTITGNAGTATALQTARTINGTSFNGTANITVTASADTLTGTTLPALSGVNLTALNASNLSSGTVPDARFPATLPAASGANLTALNGANISAGNIAVARISNALLTPGAIGSGTPASGAFTTLGATGKFTGQSFNTSDYTFKTGSFLIQGYALNNGFLGENTYYNGSSWTRESVGYASAFQFANGQVIFNGIGTGTGTYTPIRIAKTDPSDSGTFCAGGTVSPTLGTYTGAILVVLGTGASTFNGTLAVTGVSTLTGAVGVGGAANANAILDAQSTTKAFLPPRMTKVQRDAIASPAAGMFIYQTDNTPGARMYNGTNWMRYTETAD